MAESPQRKGPSPTKAKKAPAAKKKPAPAAAAAKKPAKTPGQIAGREDREEPGFSKLRQGGQSGQKRARQKKKEAEARADAGAKGEPQPPGRAEGPATPAAPQRRLELRGGAEKLLVCQDPEVVLAGPAGSGKSLAALAKLHLICENVPGSRCLMIRRTRESLTESAMVTYEKKVLPPGHPVLASGGMRRMRQAYTYPNGSQIILGGLDNPVKVMSTDYDIIYVQEAIEIPEADWETLLSRVRHGALPYQQVMGDTNPSSPRHWIRTRALEAGKLTLLESRHEDNPYLWAPADGGPDGGPGGQVGRWTDAGEKYLKNLDALTGVRYWRLRHGHWRQAEGVVYDGWDRAEHLVDRFEVPLEWDRYLVVDFGYTCPFTAQWWAKDHDGRLYLYREIYHTKRLVEDHARQILDFVHRDVDHWLARGDYTEQEVLSRLRFRALVCDHDAEDRATLTRHLGMSTTPAFKRVKPGIEAVQSRLREQPDGRPRLFVLADALVERDQALKDAGKPCCLADEIDSYVWADPESRRREEPRKEDDHGCDALRYLCCAVDLGADALWESPSSLPVPRRDLRPGGGGDNEGRQAAAGWGSDGGREASMPARRSLRLFGRGA